MKTNYRRPGKDKGLKNEELERREAKVKALKTERKERHKAKNQRVHQLRYMIIDDEDL